MTVTVTVNTVPVQVPDVGVTVYVAVSATAAVLVRLSFNVVWPVCAPPALLKSDCRVGALHAYLVPVAIVPLGE